MSATVFLLILAAVIIVFVAYVIKSWSALGNVTRIKTKKRGLKDDADDGSGD